MTDRTCQQADRPPAQQTSAQWGVRWFAVVSVAVLCASVPLVHLLWHGVLGRDEPVVRTRSQVPAPRASFENVLAGEWMVDKEVELREASPWVWWLRGNWNELLYRAGVPQSRDVHFGDDGWLFIASSVRPDNRGYERATARRRAFLGEVRDAVAAAGAELFVMVVPDKARVYADLAFTDGELPAGKRGNYDRMLTELGELGIATVDLATPLAAAAAAERAAGAQRLLYYARDTHWRPGGALIAERVVAAELERRYGERLSPRVRAEITGPLVARAVGDLTGMLGLLTAIRPDPVTGQRTAALSLLSDRLAEQREYYGVQLLSPAGPVAMRGDDVDAEVLLVGTSFSEENGMSALSLHLGRPVRGTIMRGAQGMKPLLAALDELRGSDGAKAKIVVWELVERGMFEGAWLDPKF